MIRKTFTKLVYGLKTKLHESGKSREVTAVDHRVDLVRGGEGPPLLYLHSLVGESRWLPFHQKLGKRFDVLAPAHPGLGGSESVDIDLVEDVVFHYLDLLDSLEFERVHVVGVSFGGWMAAELAIRAPDRVDRLVIADAVGLEVDAAAVADVVSARLDATALRELMFASPDGPMAEIALPLKADSDLMRAASSTIGLATHLSGSLASRKLGRRLRRVGSPTLLLWGEQDRIVPLAHATAWRDGIPDSELVVLDRCGHLPQFEREDRFVDAASDFLSRRSMAIGT